MANVKMYHAPKKMCKRNEDKRDIHVVELMLYALFQDKRENKKT